MILTSDLTMSVRETLAQHALTPDHDSIAQAIRTQFPVVGEATVDELTPLIQAELVGFSVVQDLVDDPHITDVVINGPESIWVDRGAGLVRVDVAFANEGEVRQFAVRLAGSVGRRLDDANPYVDCGLDRGIRLHAVLPPISGSGTLVSLRIPRVSGFSLAELQASGSLGVQALDWLRVIVQSRVAFLLTGGTGTGKTTLLSALLSLVEPDDRLVLVEDSAELKPQHPHVVFLQSRHRNIEGAGEVSVRDLVRQALRMRPDRLVVGEARGPEVIDLLSAMNTGHEGGCGTLHANSPADVPARIAALAAPAGWSRDSAMAQLGSALDVILHVSRTPAGQRWLQEIAVVRSVDDRVEIVAALRWDCTGAIHSGAAFNELSALVTR
jgi:pilus assembly protein CpaF